MCNFVPRLGNDFVLSFFENTEPFLISEEISYLAIELLVHSSPKIQANFVSFSQTKLLVHFYFFLHKFSCFDMFLV